MVSGPRPHAGRMRMAPLRQRTAILILSVLIPGWLYAGTSNEPNVAELDFVWNAIAGLVRHAQDLGLNSDQVERIKDLGIDYKRALIRNQADAELAELDVQALLQKSHEYRCDIESATH